jgi:hypothetical protein
VVIFPFSAPGEDPERLLSLYRHLASLKGKRAWHYSQPLTIIDQRTVHKARTANLTYSFEDLLAEIARLGSDALIDWHVDTCQMWFAGLGRAYQRAIDRGADADVFWLIPGDYDYRTVEGQQKLFDRVAELPREVSEGRSEFTIGEVRLPPTSAKELIDVYGTYLLLYNWFPHEAIAIRQATVRPRSEFLALKQDFLGELLRQRWFPYEQTLVMLLEAFRTGRRARSVTTVNLPLASDPAEGRDTPVGAMMQVERTERMLKAYWQEQYRTHELAEWSQRYRELAQQSTNILVTARIVFERVFRS